MTHSFSIHTGTAPQACLLSESKSCAQVMHDEPLLVMHEAPVTCSGDSKLPRFCQ